MVLSTIIALSLLPSADPVPTRVIAASLFKNGYAVVVREAAFPAAGDMMIAELPQAVLGTLWITASPGVKLRDLVVTNLEKSEMRDAQNFEEVLSANVGRNLTITTSDRSTYVGMLKSASGSLLVMDCLENGKPPVTIAIQKAVVQQITAARGDLIWQLKQRTSSRVMKLHADAAQKGSVYIVSLERGLTWAPGYSLDISDPKKLHLVAKATIMNDLADVNNIELRLVTGFPNVPFINLLDPLTTQQNLNQWADQLMQAGTPDARFRGGAGFGGQMAGNMAYQRAGEFSEAFDPSTLQGLQAEDLFFYRQPNVELKRGDRGYYVLLAMDADYQHIYEWEVQDQIKDDRYYNPNPSEAQVQNDVWHSIRFKNESKQPLTTASAVTVKNGEILGQDMMKYTSIGAESCVKITKAMDVKAEDAEEEVARERESLKLRSAHYDLVTLKGTLRVINRKNENIKLEITKYLTGEVKSSDGKPAVTTQAKGLRAVNPRQKLMWTVELKPGEKTELNYTYTVYING